jgi:hypothetical protein
VKKVKKEKKEIKAKAQNLTREDREYLEKYGEKLSSTTKNAKWINGPKEHEDYPGQALVTRNKEVIRQWAEERQAQPATVPGTEHEKHLGVLQFDFPGYGGRDLAKVSWDDWFKAFDKRKLAFMFQENQKSGRPSNFFHMDSPFREKD